MDKLSFELGRIREKVAVAFCKLDDMTDPMFLPTQLEGAKKEKIDELYEELEKVRNALWDINGIINQLRQDG